VAILSWEKRFGATVIGRALSQLKEFCLQGEKKIDKESILKSLR
jgi:hypothetical protein